MTNKKYLDRKYQITINDKLSKKPLWVQISELSQRVVTTVVWIRKVKGAHGETPWSGAALPPWAWLRLEIDSITQFVNTRPRRRASAGWRVKPGASPVYLPGAFQTSVSQFVFTYKFCINNVTFDVAYKVTVLFIFFFCASF